MRRQVETDGRRRCGYCQSQSAIGITASGRATVVALRLNNADSVAARALWVMAGWHPPVD